DHPRVIVTKGRIVVIGAVLFDSGRATIRPKSRVVLDDIATAMKEHPEIRHVRIEGHTDNVGPPALNLKLSEERASSVRHGLEQRGVAASRLDTRGYGETKPIAPNRSPAGRAKNRRVEFYVSH